MSALKKTFVSSILLAALCGTTSMAAPSTDPVAPAAGPAQDIEPRYEAMARLALNDPAGACRVLDDSYPAETIDQQILLLRGRCNMQLKQYDRAAANYQTLTDIRPDMTRERLELGKAYAQMGNYKRAKKIYTAVLDTHPPENLAKRLQEAITVLNQQQPWYLRTELGVVYDTNINSGPASDQIIVFDNPLTLTGSAVKQDSFGHMLNADAGYSHRLSKSTAFIIQSNFNRTDYIESDDFDINTFTIGAGPGWASGKWKSILQPNFTWQTLGGDTYRTMFSLTNRTSYKLADKVEAAITASGQKTSYPTLTGREGEALITSPEIAYVPNKETRVSLGGVTRWEDADSDIYSNSAYGARVVAAGRLDDNLKAMANYQFLYSDYEGPQAAFGNRARTDRQHVGSLRLDYDISKYTFENVNLSFKYQYIKNGSNIDAYEFDRHVGTFSISKSW